MKSLLLTDDLSVMDDRIGPPPTREPADLGDLLSTVADRLDDGGVLMLSGRWARYVTPVADDGGDDHPVTAHAGDWQAKVRRGDVWIRWTLTHTADGPSLWTCDVDALEPYSKSAPLVDANPVVTASQFAEWHRITGAPWVGTPGMTGNALLIDGWADMNPKAAPPRWNTSGIWLPQHGGDRWAYGHIEQAYTPAQWSRDHDGPVHGYDLNKAYLSALSVVELPAGKLEQYEPAEFDSRLGGIWRVELSPWPHSHLLPDPAGYAPALDDGTRWLTSPTLHLLQQLTDRGDYGGFAIRQAWLAPVRRVTRKWAGLLNDVTAAAAEPYASAAKQVYKQTWGMWANAGRVHRPDWHYTLIAQARANLWRKMDAAYLTDPRSGMRRTCYRQVTAGTRPVRVETDAVFYDIGDQPWDTFGQSIGLKLDATGRALGAFKPYEPKGPR